MDKNIVSNKQKWWILAGVAIASFLGCADFTIVNTALPAIQNNLHTTISQLQWIINIFILALSSFMVIMGRIADIYGRRLILYTGMIVFAFASLLAGCAINIQWLIFWRFVQGIACAVLYTGSGAIVSNTFPIEERGQAMGIFFGISFTGLAAGPVLGGILVGTLGWRWVFLINIPVIIISLLICAKNLKESKNIDVNPKLDYLGTLILMIGISSLIITITQGSIWGIKSYKTLTTLITTIIAFPLFYYVEEKSNNPIIKFSLFINRSFISGTIATFFLAFFYCLAFFLMPLYLREIRGETDYAIGLMLLPTTIMVSLVSPIIGKMVDRKGPYKPLLFGFIFFIISAILQVCFSTHTSIVMVLTAFILMGIAWGSIVGPSTILSISGLPRSREALAIGASWTLHNIGGSIGLSLGVLIYHIELTKFNNSFLDGFRSAMLLLVFSSLFAFITILWNFHKSKKQ
ncbi:MAG: MFS transporter [Neisseriaceae bacterium]